MSGALWVAAVCLVMEAFFSGTEIAIVAFDRLALRKAVAEGHRSARLLSAFIGAPQRLLATTLMGTQIAVVTSTVTMTLWMTDRYGEHAELYTLLVLTPVLVIFGEIVPKSLAQQHSQRLAPILIYPLYVASMALWPVVALLTRFSMWVGRLLGVDTGHKLVTREDLELILKSKPSASTEITEGERKMIARIFDVGDASAYDLMVPLSSVAALDEETPLEQVVSEFEDKGFTRFPIYRERVDRIVGVVHAFDVLKLGKSSAPLSEVMRPAVYVPENKPALDLLVELQRRRQAMAVVVDEYGGAVGVVTVEDVLEEIVGEIDDEYDTDSPAIRQEGEGVWRVRARTTIRELNQKLHIDLPEGDDYETLGGLVIDRLKHIPRTGELLREGAVQLRITVATERAVEEVEVRVVRRR